MEPREDNRFAYYQGDITNCQAISVRWLVVLLKSLEKPINMEIIYQALRDLERDWDRTELGSSETEHLGQSFSLFIDVSMERVKTLLLAPSNKARACLEYILRCLGFLSEMKAFSCCCPFHKDIRTDVVMTVKRATTERYLG